MRLVNITKSYPAGQGGKKVFDNFSLDLPDRGAVWIMGESGCGKTTLLRIIAGLEDFEGTVEDRPSSVSMVFQENRLFEELSAEDNCLLVCKYSRSGGKALRLRIREMLTATGIPEADVSRPVKGFSGGMKRRTAIVRALCASSDALLMDEPFTGIDSENRLATGKVIRENLGDRLFIGVTHNKADCGLIEGKAILVNNRV
ncbi:MAG: ATP-binding cassette domain-containing protein [Ruminococcus sp.]|nr:ATP-binding cassette domain-containing protein [Ruminococcus sp.]